jgi:hypothetical protein
MMDSFEKFMSRGHRPDLMAFVGQLLAVKQADVLFIIHYQDSCHIFPFFWAGVCNNSTLSVD